MALHDLEQICWQLGAYEKDGKIHMDLVTFANDDAYNLYLNVPHMLDKVRGLNGKSWILFGPGYLIPHNFWDHP